MSLDKKTPVDGYYDEEDLSLDAEDLDLSFLDEDEVLEEELDLDEDEDEDELDEEDDWVEEDEFGLN